MEEIPKPTVTEEQVYTKPLEFEPSPEPKKSRPRSKSTPVQNVFVFQDPEDNKKLVDNEFLRLYISQDDIKKTLKELEQFDTETNPEKSRKEKRRSARLKLPVELAPVVETTEEKPIETKENTDESKKTKKKHRKHRRSKKEEAPTIQDDSSVNYTLEPQQPVVENSQGTESNKVKKKKKALWWVDQKEVEKDIIVRKQEFLHQRQEELRRLKELIEFEFKNNNKKVAEEVYTSMSN